MTPLYVQPLTPTATIPTRADSGSVGYDLASDDDGIAIEPGGRRAVGTGIAVAIPEGCYGRIAPRSGLAVGYGIDVLAGVVDPGYRGEIKVVLQNGGSGAFVILRGDRIAQLIIERCATPPVVVDDLDETERGERGFGSTGR